MNYVTYNCLQNLGYTSYTLAQCKSPLNAFGGGNPSTMSNWLNNQGFNSYYSNSGYLTISQIDSVILNNHCYVMISAGLTNTSGHAFLIYGAHSDGYIRYWDPRSTSYSTSSSPYTSLLGSDGYTYTWNHGYYYLDVEWD